ncbi:MAG TPA: hypothetical protein VHX61_10930 [Rhizomicrobium sp.]|jgi:hypothetical protein|nr:hypothetical protein [Rhizomicrobium sp.]
MMHGIDRRLVLASLAAAGASFAVAAPASLGRSQRNTAQIRRLSEFAWKVSRDGAPVAEAIVVTTPALLEAVCGPWIQNGAPWGSTPRPFGPTEEADFAPESEDSERLTLSPDAASEMLLRMAREPGVSRYLLAGQAGLRPRIFALASFKEIEDDIPWMFFNRRRQKELLRRSFGGTDPSVPRLDVVTSIFKPHARLFVKDFQDSSCRVVILPEAPRVAQSDPENCYLIALDILTLWPVHPQWRIRV